MKISDEIESRLHVYLPYSHLGIAEDTHLIQTVAIAGERLGIEGELADAPSLIMKGDVCLQRMPPQTVAQSMMPRALPVEVTDTQPVLHGSVVDVKILQAEARVCKAEERARRAEMHARAAIASWKEMAMQLHEANMRACAAEQALALQSCHVALEKGHLLKDYLGVAEAPRLFAEKRRGYQFLKRVWAACRTAR